MSHKISTDSGVNSVVGGCRCYNAISRSGEYIFNSIRDEDGSITWTLTTTKNKIREYCKRAYEYYEDGTLLPGYSQGVNQGIVLLLKSFCTEFDNDPNDIAIHYAFDKAYEKVSHSYCNSDLENVRAHALRVIAECITSDTSSSSESANTLIKGTSTEYLFLKVLEDNWYNPLESFTSPHFYPGRVLLIGDAAHTISQSTLGLGGAMVAIFGVHVFINSFIKTFHEFFSSADTERLFTRTREENDLLSRLADMYDKKMLAFSAEITNIIHAEQEEYLCPDISIENKLWRITKKLFPKTFTSMNFISAMNMKTTNDIPWDLLD